MRGVDAVIDMGGAATLSNAIRSVCMQGTVMVIGAAAGREATIPVNLLFCAALTIRRQVVGHREHQLVMAATIDAHRIKPVIGAVFPLSDLAEAFGFQEGAGHFGKIVIDP